MNNKTILALGALWLFTLVVAYLAGQTLVAPPAAPVQVAETVQPESPQEPVRTLASKPPELVPGRPALPLVETKTHEDPSPELAGATYAPMPADPMLARPVPYVLKQAMQSPHPVQRYTWFSHVLENLNEDNIADALAVFENLSPAYDRQRELNLLLYAWAQFDGPSAMAYVHEMDESYMSRMASFYTLSGWAAADEAGALTWARENFEGEDNPYMIGVIDGVAQNNLNRATELLYGLPYGRNRGRAVDSLITGYLREGSRTTMRWAEELPKGVLRDGIIQRVADRLARENPASTAAWVVSLDEGDGQRRAVYSVAARWGREDPSEAATWAVELPRADLRTHSLVTIVDRWARTDPHSTAEWLLEQPPSPELDRPVEAFSNRIMRSDPETALSWAATISDTARRDSLTQRILRDWSRRDPEAAERYTAP